MSGECNKCGEHCVDCKCKWEDTEEGQEWMNAPMGKPKSPWISVKDKLPLHSERVGYVTDGENIRHDTFMDRSNNQWFYTNALDYEIHVNVSYWMPLPELPEG